MAGGEWLCPDAAVVRRERLARGIPKGPAPFAPDVAFEVISPNDTWVEIQRKRRVYRENGVVQVWVDPEERTAAAAFTNTARYVSRPFGPGVGAGLTSGLGIGAPFVAAGALKALYDLLLWKVFRKVELPEFPDALTKSPPRNA